MDNLNLPKLDIFLNVIVVNIDMFGTSMFFGGLSKR